MPSSPTHKNLDALIEQPDSGKMVFSKGKVTQTRIYVAKYTVCVAASLGYGTVGTGQQFGYTVGECTVDAIGAEQGKLTIVWEAGGPDGGDSGQPLPPDEWNTQPQDLQPRVERTPGFTNLSRAQSRLCANAASPDQSGDTAWQTLIDQYNADPNGPGGNGANAAAVVLADFLRRGIESKYQAAKTYNWILNSFAPFDELLGGWAENPGGPGIGYQPANLSWLRLADAQSYSGGIYQLTRTWLGGPDGHWDPILYSQ